MSDDLKQPDYVKILSELAESYAKEPAKFRWHDGGPTFSMNLGLLSAEESAALEAKDYNKLAQLVAARPPVQFSFFIAGGPTADQLAGLSGQCDETEWLRLCRNAEFISAACRDLAETAAVASKILGREISTSKK